MARNKSERSTTIAAPAGICERERGDIIFKGNPEGVIPGYPKDKQVRLRAGDKIACRVEKLGELRFGLV
jgi:2-keto-4-pentenoate hydratase/2-oxohepta-3-ene-1,7-dioic acid hydratase in catechol pathway